MSEELIIKFMMSVMDNSVAVLVVSREDCKQFVSLLETKIINGNLVKIEIEDYSNNRRYSEDMMFITVFESGEMVIEPALKYPKTLLKCEHFVEEKLVPNFRHQPFKRPFMVTPFCK